MLTFTSSIEKSIKLDSAISHVPNITEATKNYIFNSTELDQTKKKPTYI